MAAIELVSVHCAVFDPRSVARERTIRAPARLHRALDGHGHGMLYCLIAHGNAAHPEHEQEHERELVLMND